MQSIKIPIIIKTKEGINIGCIYRIINNINNKCYVGYTTGSFDVRMRKHKNDDTHLNTILGRAIKKYGWDNFQCEIVEECDNKYDLLEKEKYYIRYYNSLTPNGYNMTIGGEKLFGEHNPFFGKQHSQETKEKLSTMASNRIGELNPFYGKHHNEQTKQLIANSNSKKVANTDNNGRIINIFDSIKNAAQWCLDQNLTKSQYASSDICKRCKDGKKAFGFYWTYFDECVETMADECKPVE